MYMQSFFDIFLPLSMIFYLIEIKSTEIDLSLKNPSFCAPEQIHLLF